MDLPSKQVHRALVNVGATHIHHANTVLTACQFIRARALLSRGTVERRGLLQTDQYSDGLDKKYGIWFDVFTDSVDIHARAGYANHYGPVLFVLDVALIEKAYTGRVWVTKLNPTKWKGRSAAERWFQSKDDLADNFSYGTFDHMIVFRHCGGELPFGKYLEKVVLDDPKMETEDGRDLFSVGYGALRLAMTDTGLNVPIERRACKARCRCKNDYQTNEDSTLERFLPQI
jgi:hypothetical protein